MNISLVPNVGDNATGYANIMGGYFAEENRIWDESARVPYLSFHEPTGTEGRTLINLNGEGDCIIPPILPFTPSFLKFVCFFVILLVVRSGVEDFFRS